jgi:hypothetical protein
MFGMAMLMSVAVILQYVSRNPSFTSGVKLWLISCTVIGLSEDDVAALVRSRTVVRAMAYEILPPSLYSSGRGLDSASLFQYKMSLKEEAVSNTR